MEKKPYIVQERSDQDKLAKVYLAKFGHGECHCDTVKCEHLPLSIANFQSFFRLPVTRRLDGTTSWFIRCFRCGLPDFSDYTLSGRKWENLTLSYSLINSTLDVVGEGDAISTALKLWSHVVQLNFIQELVDPQKADIRILWGLGEHGDGNPFDGVGGVLAHAFYPPPNGGELAGDVHFDDAEQFYYLSGGTIDLITVAAHELGHSLGLGHSRDTAALMAPFYRGPHRFLNVDDIAGIRTLYPARMPTQPRRSFWEWLRRRFGLPNGWGLA